MTLKKQLKSLAQEAPQYGISTIVMEKAVLPILLAFAQHLQHEEYYILQNQAGEWSIDTLSHQGNPQIEKKVIYAFGSSGDALEFPNPTNPGWSPRAIPVTHLLFQLFALGEVDSIVFLEKAGNLNNGVEIYRSDLQNSLQRQLKQLKNSFSTPSNLA